MNARQKAKRYKKIYQELLGKPVKVIVHEHRITPEHLRFRRAIPLDPKMPDTMDHVLNIFIDEMAMDLRRYLAENNISIHHSKSAHLDIFEADLYLSFDKGGLLEVPINDLEE